MACRSGDNLPGCGVAGQSARLRGGVDQHVSRGGGEVPVDGGRESSFGKRLWHGLVRHRIAVLAAGGVCAAILVAVTVVLVTRTGDRTDPVVAGPSPTSPASTGPLPADLPDDGAQARPVPVVRADAGAREVEGQLTDLDATTVRYGFDSGPAAAVTDAGGGNTLRPLGAGGGAVAFPRRGDGYAAKFPGRCDGAPDTCPRAILESAGTEQLNPGTRPIRFGAAVLMRPDDTGPGANVLQKGFSKGGGTQFKLQVDGAAGKPSCVLADDRKIYRLTGAVSVADGQWHTVTCTRAGDRMSINIDGVAISRSVPAALSIHNTAPLRIGGKSVAPGNDQFAGQLDDVFVTLY